MSRHKKVGGRIMKYEKVPGCIMGELPFVMRERKSRKTISFAATLRRGESSATCVRFAGAGSQKPPPVIFPELWGRKQEGKEATLLLDGFQPLGLEMLFQPTCLSASSSGLTPPLHLFLPLALIIASQLINSLHISSFLATAWRV